LVIDLNFESYIKTKKYHPLKPVWQLVADVLLSNIRAKTTIGNSIERSLGNLAMEGTIFMIMCLPLALGLSLQHAEWFFQGMLLIIVGSYLTLRLLMALDFIGF
jgi:hypothetical protein